MRFIQFCRKSDKKIRLGVLSKDNRKYYEFPDEGCFRYDMISFIKQDFNEGTLKQTLETLKPRHVSKIKLLPPIINPEKIICVIGNYKNDLNNNENENKCEPMKKEERKSLNSENDNDVKNNKKKQIKKEREQREQLLLFTKFPNTLIGQDGNIIAHPETNQIDYSIALVIVIGKEGKNIDVRDAKDYIFGYSIAQNITARDWIKRNDKNDIHSDKSVDGGLNVIASSMNTFCPFGPAIAHKSLIKTPEDLNIQCKVNGIIKQCASVNDMVLGVDEIVSRLSKYFTLKPGDIILTGEPPKRKSTEKETKATESGSVEKSGTESGEQAEQEEQAVALPMKHEGGEDGENETKVEKPSEKKIRRKPTEFLQVGDVIESQITVIGKLVNYVVQDEK